MTASVLSGGAVTLDKFNQLDQAEAADLLRPCLHVERWVAALVRARRYRSMNDLVAVARSTAQPLTSNEITAALADRLNRTPWPPPVILQHASTDGVQGVMARQILDDAERYTAQFGQPFIVRAVSRTLREILTKLQIRLHNTREAERRAVAHELREIALLTLTHTITD